MIYKMKLKFTLKKIGTSLYILIPSFIIKNGNLKEGSTLIINPSHIKIEKPPKSKKPLKSH